MEFQSLEQYREKYIESTEIGHGQQGRVLKIQLRSDPTKVRVAKQVKSQNLNEILILKQVRHPNIIELIEQFQDDKTCILILEYCPQGDLQQKIKSQAHYFNYKTIQQWILQLVMALAYLHDQKIVHGDLQSQNVFLMEDGQLKLGDFGSGKIGEIQNWSPELQGYEAHSNKSDVWQLGSLIVELCTLSKTSLSDGKVLMQRYPIGLTEFLEEIMQLDPDQRPSAKELLKHHYILDIMMECYSPKKIKGTVTQLHEKVNQRYQEQIRYVKQQLNQ